MKYDAILTNAKPPGEIHSKGTFGPWATAEPGDTPLTGEYDFKGADLGVSIAASAWVSLCPTGISGICCGSR